MNHPYLKASPKKSTREILFAPEVYREDVEPPRRDRTEALAQQEIARLRAELRGETRPARAAAKRESDEATLTIAAAGIEGPAAAALARSANAKSRGVRAALAAMIDTAPCPWELAEEGPIVVALVGPAGVGKTTTAAKLGARAIMAGKTVAFVSCDAFRVGAIDQLGKYADLMEASFSTAMNQEELLDIIATEDADVIIVDTVGRRVEPDSTEALFGDEAVRATTRGDARARGGAKRRHLEVLLCVPASIRAGDMQRVQSDFALANPTGIIVTKLDETAMPAGIVHAAYATRLPLTTVCNGQRVPEDIMPASPRVLIEAVLPLSTKAADESR